jgi:fimbrial chaperone protein
MCRQEIEMIWTTLGRIAVLCLSFLFALGTSATAHEVSPMRVVLVPADGRGQATITVNNTRDDPLMVEMKTFVRVTEPDGAERLDETDDAFIVFPPQFQVPPRTSQAIRIQYVGPPATNQALSYVVQVAEVPVEMPGFSGVRFTYNFGVAVYVEPPRAVERLSVVSAQRSEEGLRVVVRNAGTRFGLLHLNRLIVTVGDQRLELAGDDLAERIENPLLPPGMDRIVEVRMPDLPTDGAVSAEVRAR